MRAAAIILFAVALLIGSPLRGDDVYLTNGKVFEGVIASEEGDRIRVRLSIGELSLPRDSVLEVRKSDSGLAEYLERRQALRRDPGASAREWLELARWADARELEHAWREAVLTAAELDPGLEELRPAMRRLDRVYDPSLDRWRPSTQGAARFAAAEERPLPPPPQEDRDGQDTRSRGRGITLLEDRLSRSLELLALAEAERASRSVPTQSPVVAPVLPFYPVVVSSGWFFPPEQRRGGQAPLPQSPTFGNLVPQPRNQMARELLLRQPGSLLPVGSIYGQFASPGR